MAWTLFILGCIAAWNGVAAETKGLAGALIQVAHLLIGVSVMAGSMYLRSIGW